MHSPQKNQKVHRLADSENAVNRMRSEGFRNMVNELQDQTVLTASISANCNENFGNIPIITVETRQKSPTIPIKGAPSLVMCNVGVSHTWKGAITKNELLLEELATRMKETH